jgi:hypothetical protein
VCHGSALRTRNFSNTGSGHSQNQKAQRFLSEKEPSFSAGNRVASLSAALLSIADMKNGFAALCNTFRVVVSVLAFVAADNAIYRSCFICRPTNSSDPTRPKRPVTCGQASIFAESIIACQAQRQSSR